MAKSIKVSFEITDNYDIEGFRNFIQALLEDEAYDVYLISNDDVSMYILKTADNLGMDSEKVIITNFQNDKIQAIQNNNIDIHIDNLQSTVLLVDELTDAYGVLVTPNLNRFYLEPDYIISFNSLVRRLQNGQEETNC